MAGAALTGWTGTQRHVVAASYLAWTLDALDFFLLVFVIKDVAVEFGVGLPAVALAVTLTLAARPLGAFLFGRLADRYGRRPVLMANVLVFSALSFATAFTQGLPSFLVVRALFGIGMGGIWGIGASLAMETIPVRARGLVSGLLQSGYASGYLLASIAYALLYGALGWRGMFTVAIVPALLLVPYIWVAVPESPAFLPAATRRIGILAVLRRHARLTLYAIVLMTAFNFFSHGVQDLYPTFLQKGRGLGPHAVGTIAVIYNVGAVIGSFLFGSLSQRFGRRRMMITSALLTLPCIVLWAYAPGTVLLAAGAFLVNLFCQGAWSVIPAHLNELSPPEARATFPGTVYQLGNLVASGNLALQALVAERLGYSAALAIVAASAALAISLLLAAGPEAHGVEMGASADA